MSEESKLKSNRVASPLSYEAAEAANDGTHVREVGKVADAPKMGGGWFGQDVEAWAATISQAFSEGKAKAIEENIRLFGRAEGPVMEKK